MEAGAQGMGHFKTMEEEGPHPIEQQQQGTAILIEEEKMEEIEAMEHTPAPHRAEAVCSLRTSQFYQKGLKPSHLTTLLEDEIRRNAPTLMLGSSQQNIQLEGLLAEREP